MSSRDSSPRHALALLVLSLVVSHAIPVDAAPPENAAAALAEGVQRSERFWQQISAATLPEKTGVRAVFAYALLLCEARKHPERLERVFEQGARFQDRDPKSPGFGNLKWTWRDAGVTDANAIEFCMQDALLVWLRHRPWLPEPARRRLGDMLPLAAEGCLRHRVPTVYTNIALLNAGNLIVLGEVLERPEVTEEGLRRLDGVCLWTSQFGTAEYCSPTYYGTDLAGLRWIEANARHPRARSQAVALLKFFWTDLALNWHPKFHKLTGAQSRSYDYLQGIGSLDGHLIAAGWLGAPPSALGDGLQALAGGRWLPPNELHTLHADQLPRLVRQRWGIRPADSRTSMIYTDVALGTAAACYGNQDVPLAVDLAGPRDSVRCYFLPDGREDPYGRIRYETGIARHMKALHLQPFWTAAQRTCDALGLVVYRPEDLAASVVTNVQSHFVFRRTNHGLWLGGQPIVLPSPAKPDTARIALGVGQPLVIRYGTAAVGLRVLWARAEDGQSCDAALIDDGNPHGAIRLTIEHRRTAKSALPGAALWGRVGSGLDSDRAFDAWRSRFEASAKIDASVSDSQLRFSVPGQDGPVAITADVPFGRGGTVALEPKPTEAPLELDGRDIGRPILAGAEAVAARKDGLTIDRPLRIPPSADVGWEAEQGLVFPGMQVLADAEASGGQYVCQPKQRPVHSPTGPVLWPIHVEQGGRYYLWARVLAADTESDSFQVRVVGDGIDSPYRRWDLRLTTQWMWQPVALDKASDATAWDLPAGLQLIEFRLREAGARVDRLWISRSSTAGPDSRSTSARPGSPASTAR